MQLDIEVDARKLTIALAKAPTMLQKELRVVLKEQIQDVVSDARRVHRFITRSGNLKRSMKYSVERNGLSARAYLNTLTASYGPYQHEGTGIYGPKKRVIKPTIANVLKFRSTKTGEWVSKRSVRGIPKDQFLYKAFDRAKKKISKNLSAAIDKAIREAGL